MSLRETERVRNCVFPTKLVMQKKIFFYLELIWLTCSEIMRTKNSHNSHMYQITPGDGTFFSGFVAVVHRYSNLNRIVSWRKTANKPTK